MNSAVSIEKAFTVSAPSNIAFVKYWGKRDSQNTIDLDRNLPLNSSISLTLENARTFTAFGSTSDSSQDFKLIWENTVPSEKDILKVKYHVQRVFEFLNVSPHSLKGYFVSTKNNFPMGTGLASSASAFAALTCAVLGFFWGEDKLLENLSSNQENLSALARRGSGSASRSLRGPFVRWDNAFAKKLEQAEWKLYDTIVFFSKEHKKVPSSEGHKSASSSSLFGKRLAQLDERIKIIETSIHNKDIHSLGKLLELEATELHEIARTGEPSITYATPDTNRFLEVLKNLPKRDFYFTLDAGPNVHLISDRPVDSQVKALLSQNNFSAEIWMDHSGNGARIESYKEIF